MRKEYLYTPRVRLYSDNQRDIEIQKWLEGLPSGIKSEMMKQAIWTSISGKHQNLRQSTHLPEPPYYKPENKAVTTNAKMSASVSLDTRELLADIRQIIEVCVAQGFAHHGSASFGSSLAPEQEDEVETLLDNLSMSFMIDDDDDEEE